MSVGRARRPIPASHPTTHQGITARNRPSDAGVTRRSAHAVALSNSAINATPDRRDQQGVLERDERQVECSQDAGHAPGEQSERADRHVVDAEDGHDSDEVLDEPDDVRVAPQRVDHPQAVCVQGIGEEDLAADPVAGGEFARPGVVELCVEDRDGCERTAADECERQQPEPQCDERQQYGVDPPRYGLCTSGSIRVVGKFVQSINAGVP